MYRVKSNRCRKNHLRKESRYVRCFRGHNSFGIEYFMACDCTKSNAPCRHIKIIEGAFHLVEALGGDVGVKLGGLGAGVPPDFVQAGLHSWLYKPNEALSI